MGYLVASTHPTAEGVLTGRGAYGGCGFGHSDPEPKVSVDFTFTPALGIDSVTLTGFVLEDISAWYTVSTTLPVVRVDPPPRPPMSPPQPPPPPPNVTLERVAEGETRTITSGGRARVLLQQQRLWRRWFN